VRREPFNDAALLELARRGHDPTDTDLRRVASALERRLNVLLPTPVGPSISATVAVPPPSPSLLPIASPGLIAVAVLGVCMAGAALYHRDHRRSVAVSADIPTNSVVVSLSHPSSSSVMDGSSLVQQSIPRTVSPLESLPPRNRLVTRVGQPQLSSQRLARHTTETLARSQPDIPDSPRSFAPTEASTLEGETALLRVALRALRDRQPSKALDLLQQHEHRYPAGILSEERDAKMVVALCELGRIGDAQLRAHSFVSTYPESLLTSQVRAACPTSSAIP
jgi:hypothetical protein